MNATLTPLDVQTRLLDARQAALDGIVEEFGSRVVPMPLVRTLEAEQRAIDLERRLMTVDRLARHCG